MCTLPGWSQEQGAVLRSFWYWRGKWWETCLQEDQRNKVGAAKECNCFVMRCAGIRLSSVYAYSQVPWQYLSYCDIIPTRTRLQKVVLLGMTLQCHRNSVSEALTSLLEMPSSGGGPFGNHVGKKHLCSKVGKGAGVKINHLSTVLQVKDFYTSSQDLSGKF